jgi:polar amino acid transport system substrate-binding protein
LKRHAIPLIVFLCLTISLAACAGPTKASNPTPDANSPLTRIRVGVVVDLPPFVSYDATLQEPVGFDIDLLKAAAKKADIYVEFLPQNAGYNQMINLVQQCKLAAGVSAIPITDENPARLLYSEPYFNTGQVLVVKKGNIKINGLDSLAGMTVGTQANSLSAVALQKILGVQPKLLESFHAAFQELIAGNIDAVIADHSRAWNYVNVKSNNLKIVGKEFDSLSYGIAFCPDQGEVRAKINTALADMKKDGSLDALVKKWQPGKFGE